MSDIDGGFSKRVNALVAQIPKGRVMTYGQIAALCGNAQAARIVGGIAHFPAAAWAFSFATSEDIVSAMTSECCELPLLEPKR